MIQGDCLSPILFNLFFENILRSISNPGYRIAQRDIRFVAFADDLLLVGSDPSHIQKELNQISCVMKTFQMSFNTAKCASLSFRKGILSYESFSIYERPILVLRDGFKYLGIRLNHVNPSYTSAEGIFQKVLSSIPSIDIIGLSLHQKLDMFKTFVLSQIPYAFSFLPEISATELRKETNHRDQLLTTTLGVSIYSFSISIPVTEGGLGVPPYIYYYVRIILGNSLQLINSPNILVRTIFRELLNSSERSQFKSRITHVVSLANDFFRTEFSFVLSDGEYYIKSPHSAFLLSSKNFGNFTRKRHQKVLILAFQHPDYDHIDRSCSRYDQIATILVNLRNDKRSYLNQIGGKELLEARWSNRFFNKACPRCGLLCSLSHTLLWCKHRETAKWLHDIVIDKLINWTIKIHKQNGFFFMLTDRKFFLPNLRPDFILVDFALGRIKMIEIGVISSFTTSTHENSDWTPLLDTTVTSRQNRITQSLAYIEARGIEKREKYEALRSSFPKWKVTLNAIMIPTQVFWPTSNNSALFDLGLNEDQIITFSNSIAKDSISFIKNRIQARSITPYIKLRKLNLQEKVEKYNQLLCKEEITSLWPDTDWQLWNPIVDPKRVPNKLSPSRWKTRKHPSPSQQDLASNKVTTT